METFILVLLFLLISIVLGILISGFLYEHYINRDYLASDDVDRLENGVFNAGAFSAFLIFLILSVIFL